MSVVILLLLLLLYFTGVRIRSLIIISLFALLSYAVVSIQCRAELNLSLLLLLFIIIISFFFSMVSLNNFDFRFRHVENTFRCEYIFYFSFSERSECLKSIRKSHIFHFAQPLGYNKIPFIFPQIETENFSIKFKVILLNTSMSHQNAPLK